MCVCVLGDGGFFRWAGWRQHTGRGVVPGSWPAPCTGTAHPQGHLCTRPLPSPAPASVSSSVQGRDGSGFLFPEYRAAPVLLWLCQSLRPPRPGLQGASQAPPGAGRPFPPDFTGFPAEIVYKTGAACRPQKRRLSPARSQVLGGAVGIAGDGPVTLLGQSLHGAGQDHRGPVAGTRGLDGPGAAPCGASSRALVALGTGTFCVSRCCWCWSPGLWSLSFAVSAVSVPLALPLGNEDSALGPTLVLWPFCPVAGVLPFGVGTAGATDLMGVWFVTCLCWCYMAASLPQSQLKSRP